MEESFESLLEGTLYEKKEGLTKGIIVLKRNDGVLIDLGDKSERFLTKSEFLDEEWDNINLNDEIYVVVEGNKVSYKEARKKRTLQEIYNAQKSESPISIIIKGETKGGYLADYKGFQVFIPGSQTKGKKNIKEGDTYEIFINKVENKGENIVGSITAYENYLKNKGYEDFISNYKEGDIVEGEVKSIIEKGVFVLVNSVEGFVPFSEITYKRIKSPGDFFNVGDKIKAMIIRIDREAKKLTLSTKALEKEPFELFTEKFKEGNRTEGVVRNIIDKGVFVELLSGLDGFIPVSEISWTERVKNPSKYFKPGDRISAVIKNINKKDKKISLSFKDLINNPWEEFRNEYPEGSVVKVKVKDIVDKGVVVQTEKYLEAFIPNEYLGYGRASEEKKKLKRGETIEVKVVDVEPGKRKIILSIKDLLEDPFNIALGSIKKGDEVEAVVSGITENVVFFEIMPNVEGIVKKREFKKDEAKIGAKYSLLVTDIDEEKRKFMLSYEELIKKKEQKELEEHKSKNTVSHRLGDYFKK